MPELHGRCRTVNPNKRIFNSNLILKCHLRTQCIRVGSGWRVGVQNFEGYHVCGGLAGACTWRSSRCAHLEGQQVRAPAGPSVGMVTRVIHRDSAIGGGYIFGKEIL